MNLSINNSINRREIYGLIAAFVVFRFLLISGLYLLSGGKELASDVVFHEIIIADPLGILKGTAVHIASYPPFQWLFEWPLFSLFNLYFGEMISYRLMMVTVEFMAFLVAIGVCKKKRVSRALSLTILILFIVSPHQHFASVFFIQEDVIAQLFMLTTLLLLLHERRSLSIAMLVVAVLTAKLFFIVPLFYIILFQGYRPFHRRFVDGIIALAPLIAVYVFIITQALNNGGEVPIRDFTPDAKYAANYWVLLIGGEADLLIYYKNISLILTTIGQLCLIAIFLYFNKVKSQSLQPLTLLIVPLAFFFATFYQHMPEYLLMLWPVAALVCTTSWQQWLVVGALTFAWTPRIFHGLTRVVEGFGSAAEARTEVVGPLVNSLNIDYYMLNQLALVAQSIIYTILVACLCVLCYKLQQLSPKSLTLSKVQQ